MTVASLESPPPTLSPETLVTGAPPEPPPVCACTNIGQTGAMLASNACHTYIHIFRFVFFCVVLLVWGDTDTDIFEK